MMQNRKKMLVLVAIGVVAVIVIVGVFVGMSLNRSQQDADIVSVDESKHLGVDKILSIEDVNKALGDLGKDAQQPKLSGTLNTPELRGETASYEFTTLQDKKAVIDVEVRIYTSAEELQKSEPFKEVEGEELGGIDVDAARYFLPRLVSADDRVAIIATKDNKIYTFRLEQNANDGVSINQLAAKRVVLRLAQAADFGAIR